MNCHTTGICTCPCRAISCCVVPAALRFSAASCRSAARLSSCSLACQAAQSYMKVLSWEGNLETFQISRHIGYGYDIAYLCACIYWIFAQNMVSSIEKDLCRRCMGWAHATHTHVSIYARTRESLHSYTDEMLDLDGSKMREPSA